jgi:hypothetical protein
MNNVFVVFGSTGEYSDHQYWTVAAYDDLNKANSHAEQANAWCFENEVSEDTYSYKNWEEREALENPWDENFTCDYTGTWYTVQEVPVGGYPKP